jgi:hypothetical protein
LLLSASENAGLKKRRAIWNLWTKMSDKDSRS